MPKDDKNEIFVVVDKDDNILGYKTRYECHHNKNLIHRGIGVVIFNNRGEVLLQKRSKYKDLFPGFYSISTGGHVGKGETYLQAAKRELKEEIGISTKLKFQAKFIINSERETEMDTVYSAIHNGPFKLDLDEVEKAEFYFTEEIKKIINKLTPFALKGLKELNII